MEDVCARCHALGHGCCLIKEENIPNQIGIFYSDIQRICNHLNVSEEYFVVKDTVSDEFLEALTTSIHPIFKKIYHKNIGFKLKTIDGKCVFLSDTGCKLPDSARPLYCKIYPFWSSKDDKFINVLSSFDCLAQRQSTLSWRIVNENFGYTEEYIRGMFEEIVNAAEEHIMQLNGSNL